MLVAGVTGPRSGSLSYTGNISGNTDTNNPAVSTPITQGCQRTGITLSTNTTEGTIAAATTPIKRHGNRIKSALGTASHTHNEGYVIRYRPAAVTIPPTTA